jgi:hypothetical protein
VTGLKGKDSVLGRVCAAALRVIVVGVLVLVGGCAQGQREQVATLGDGQPDSTSGPGSTQAVSDLAACLTKAGAPAKAGDVEGVAILAWEEGYDVLMVNPWGETIDLEGLANHVNNGPRNEDLEEFLGAHFVEGAYSYGLVVDGVDFSADYERCVESSGYEPPDAGIDVRVELVAKHTLATVTNDWIACARDNGYPEWPDVEAGKADGWMTSPTAYIPLSLSIDSLRELLADCPNFDWDIAEQIEDGDVSEDPLFLTQPSIGIEDLPARAGNLEEADAEAIREQEEHYQALWDVLMEAEREFYAGRAADEPSPGDS